MLRGTPSFPEIDWRSVSDRTCEWTSSSPFTIFKTQNRAWIAPGDGDQVDALSFSRCRAASTAFWNSARLTTVVSLFPWPSFAKSSSKTRRNVAFRSISWAWISRTTSAIPLDIVRMADVLNDPSISTKTKRTSVKLRQRLMMMTRIVSRVAAPGNDVNSAST